MTDELPDAPSERLLAQAESMRDDDTVDLESSRKQPEGEFTFYVECPDCEVPMAQTTTDGTETPTEDEDVYVSEMEMHGVCPECRRMMAVASIRKWVGPIDSHPENTDT